jgi:hypothetical protein
MSKTVAERRDGRSVKVLVGDAVHAAFPDSAEILPAALRDDTVERNTISRPAPRKEKDIGVDCCYGILGRLGTRRTDEGAACGADQFGDPRLRVDERLSPLLTVDSLFGKFVCDRADSADDEGEILNDQFSFVCATDLAGDDTCVLDHVGESMRCQGEDR